MMSQATPTVHHEPRPVQAVFMLLDGKIGWRASYSAQVELGEAIRLEPLTSAGGERLDAPGGTFGGLVSPLGVAFDGDRLLATDPARNVVHCWRVTGDDLPSVLPTVGSSNGAEGTPRALDGPRGLAITQDRDLYIADTRNRRVVAFDLATLGLLGELRPPGNDEWEPWDVAAGDDGSIYVADRGNGRIHRWNPRRVYDASFSGTGMAGASRRFVRPSRIVAGASGEFYVADEHLPYITVIDHRGQVKERIAAVPDMLRHPALLGIEEPGDRLYVVTSRSDRVSVVDRDGRVLGTIPRPVQATELRVGGPVPIEPGSRILEVDDARPYMRLLNDGSDPRGDREIERIPVPAVLPGRLRGPALLRDADGVLWLVPRHGVRPGQAGDAGSRTVGSIALTDVQAEHVNLGGRLVVSGEASDVMIMAPTFSPGLSAYGVYISEALDSGIDRCQWHRIAVRMDVPEGTSVIIDTVTAGVARSTEEILQLSPDSWSIGIPNASDFLIASDPGRYMWLRVTLRGPATVTPGVRSIEVYAPRRSSLGMLPAVFQKDETSRHFLDRYLSIFDTSFAEIESTIDDLGRYLDPSGVPDEWVSWLAGWMDLAIDGAWPLHRQRDVLRALPWLYARRGTVGGLRRLVRLYTGAPEPWPHVIEHFRFRRWAQRRAWQADAGQAPTPPGVVGRFAADDALDPDNPAAGAHTFTVLVPDRAIDGVEQLQSLSRVVDTWRPAHTSYSICLVAPRMRVGHQAMIGVDAVVGTWNPTVLDRQSPIDSSILGQPAPGHPFEPLLGDVRVAESTRLE